MSPERQELVATRLARGACAARTPGAEKHALPGAGLHKGLNFPSVTAPLGQPLLSIPAPTAPPTPTTLPVLGTIRPKSFSERVQLSFQDLTERPEAEVLW